MEVYLVFEPLRGDRKGLRHEGVVQSIRVNTVDRMIMDHMDRMDHSVAILAHPTRLLSLLTRVSQDGIRCVPNPPSQKAVHADLTLRARRARATVVVFFR